MDMGGMGDMFSGMDQSCSWAAGQFAKYAGKVGKLTMSPDSDGETKLEWADGSGTSCYIKAQRLTHATESEFRADNPEIIRQSWFTEAASEDMHAAGVLSRQGTKFSWDKALAEAQVGQHPATPACPCEVSRAPPLSAI